MEACPRRAGRARERGAKARRARRRPRLRHNDGPRGTDVEFNPPPSNSSGTAEECGRPRDAELIIPPSLRERHREACAATWRPREHVLGKRLELTGCARTGASSRSSWPSTASRRPTPHVHRHMRDITSARVAGASEDASEARATSSRRSCAGWPTRSPRRRRTARLLFANDAAVRTLGFSTTEELLTAPLAEIMDRFDILDEHGRPFPLEDLPGRRALGRRGRRRGAGALPRARRPARSAGRWSRPPRSATRRAR